MNLLDRLAARFTRKATPTAVAMGAENMPTTGTGAAIVEIKKEQEEEVQKP
ncbi:MAG TPA: hypothetical protein VGH92_09880 [Gaiellaceae bacterium]|jgi:hypothetical protein